MAIHTKKIGRSTFLYVDGEKMGRVSAATGKRTVEATKGWGPPAPASPEPEEAPPESEPASAEAPAFTRQVPMPTGLTWQQED